VAAAMPHWSGTSAFSSLLFGTALCPKQFSSRHVEAHHLAFCFVATGEEDVIAHTTGELNPGAGTSLFHAMFAPVLMSQVSGASPFAETPLPLGPRKRGQLA